MTTTSEKKKKKNKLSIRHLVDWTDSDSEFMGWLQFWPAA
jgi:hypothetical protein